MSTSARFRAAYADQRKAEGRGSGGEAELLALPYLRTGPLARQWAVRARSYERFLGHYKLVLRVECPAECADPSQRFAHERIRRYDTH